MLHLARGGRGGGGGGGGNGGGAGDNVSERAAALLETAVDFLEDLLAAEGPSPSRTFGEVEGAAARQQEEYEELARLDDLEEQNRPRLVFSSGNVNANTSANASPNTNANTNPSASTNPRSMSVGGRGARLMERREAAVDNRLERLQGVVRVLNVSHAYVWCKYQKYIPYDV